MVIFLEENKGIAFLSIAVLVTVGISGTFMYTSRPTAVLIASGGEERIELLHKGGSEIGWDGLKLSVTPGQDSQPVFRDPYKHPFGEDNKLLVNAYPTIREEVEIYITGSSFGKNLVVDNTYHIVMKHSPSGVVLVDMNARVREKY